MRRYLKPPVTVAEPAGQEGVEGVVRLLLKAAVHEDVHYLPLLLVLKSEPVKHEAMAEL